MTSVDDVCNTYPKRMQELLGALNLDTPGLEEVEQAFHQGALSEACEALLKYYQNSKSGAWLRREAVALGKAQDQSADAVCEDRLTFYEQTSLVPRRADGRLQWDHMGPSNDKEWAWALNRHYHLGQILAAYRRTGNPKYVAKIDASLQDWISSSLPYPKKKSSSAMWRGLEASFRVKVWAKVFYELQDHEQFSNAARLLLLSSLPEHAHYLHHFHGGGNWATMELSALAMVAVAWPEFKDASGWIEYAKSHLGRELKSQVYPDGVQTELTSHYHWVALSNFELFADIYREAKTPLPKEFEECLQRMWNYLAATIRPDGYGLLNNDSDRDFNRTRVISAAATYGRDDWLFIASNGREGQLPKGNPSVLFPWAGHLIMRSGYDAEAQWAFFDVGPWGSGHQHNDKLHLSLSAYGRDLLVDSGRFAYQGALANKFRSAYALHSAGHNVILVDDHGQKPGPRSADSPLAKERWRIEKDFDYARGSFDQFKDVEGSVKHTRALFYVRGAFWIVLDRIETDRPRKLQALWHWHPHCTVVVRDGQVLSTDLGKGNLGIIPIGYIAWNVDIVKGQDKPHLQGWYSEKYNKAEPSPTAVYSAKIDSSTTFAWLLFPAKDQVPQVNTSILSRDKDHMTVRVIDGQKNPFDIVVPLTSERKPVITYSKMK